MNTFKINTDDAKKLADLTKGYAFAFQALGLLYYEFKDEQDMDQILMKYDDMLDGYVYKKIWDSLTDTERNLVSALDDNETIPTSTLLERINMKSNSYSKYRERLIGKGVIISPSRGYISLALPRFKTITELY